jgi:hypothetical protein
MKKTKKCEDLSVDFTEDKDEKSQKIDETYDVVLEKGLYGLGIYFAESKGQAIVDRKVPFYRLPNDTKAPGEESGIISPGDILIALDGRELGHLSFSEVVEELRNIPMGQVTLTFQQEANENQFDLQEVQQEKNDHPELEESDQQKGQERWVFSINNQEQESEILENFIHEMENRIHLLEESLNRERKCRLLAEKRNILYRQELVRLGEENTSLRYELKCNQETYKKKQAFHSKTHLAI